MINSVVHCIFISNVQFTFIFPITFKYTYFSNHLARGCQTLNRIRRPPRKTQAKQKTMATLKMHKTLQVKIKFWLSSSSTTFSVLFIFYYAQTSGINGRICGQSKFQILFGFGEIHIWVERKKRAEFPQYTQDKTSLWLKELLWYFILVDLKKLHSKDLIFTHTGQFGLPLHTKP
jgi:hypothetical protein